MLFVNQHDDIACPEVSVTILDFGSEISSGYLVSSDLKQCFCTRKNGM